ncbi:MAG TPA: hypothetical protein VIL35_15860 [Vicinamibacterales bacterium]
MTATGIHRRTSRSWVRLAAVGIATLACGTPLAAQGSAASKSAATAAALAQQLEKNKMQYIATRDPKEEGRYIAAAHFPGSLMVISATYAAPVLLNEKLLTRKYQEAYIDLNSASEPASRIFIEDLQANGFTLKKVKDGPIDAYEVGGKRIVFDFDWRKQKMSEEEYFATLQKADEQYARMLALLLEEAKRPE